MADKLREIKKRILGRAMPAGPLPDYGDIVRYYMRHRQEKLPDGTFRLLSPEEAEKRRNG